jgi:hypothetical protein
MEYRRNERIERNLNDVIGNNDGDIRPVTATIQHLTLRGELSVHGAGLHLALPREFLERLIEVLFDYLNIKSKSWQRAAQQVVLLVIKAPGPLNRQNRMSAATIDKRIPKTGNETIKITARLRRHSSSRRR